MNTVKRYAQLLVHYSLELKKGEKLFIRTTTLAESLVREVYREAIKIGAFVDVEMDFREKYRIFMEEASGDQLEKASLLYEHAVNNYDAFLVIRAPYNLMENQGLDSKKIKERKKHLRPIQSIYNQRTSSGSLKRTLCQWPTQAAAQMAKMSLEQYEHFVFNACHLYAENPAKEWMRIREKQQSLVDFLNTKDKIQYKSEMNDIEFSVKDRIWINSDGRNNMPSGEVFTGPVEETVNGVVHFDYPSVYMGHEVEGITLWVKNGTVEKWEAKKGQSLLDKIMDIEGAKVFGEVAIGTNYNIQEATGNILFDEKIGGTIHMALGQSYFNTGGRNESSIHWDMISDMKKGNIYADGEKIYENGEFLIL